MCWRPFSGLPWLDGVACSTARQLAMSALARWHGMLLHCLTAGHAFSPTALLVSQMTALPTPVSAVLCCRQATAAAATDAGVPGRQSCFVVHIQPTWRAALHMPAAARAKAAWWPCWHAAGPHFILHPRATSSCCRIPTNPPPQVWVNHKYRVIYLRHAKTGSSSLFCHFSGCRDGNGQADTAFVPLTVGGEAARARFECG